MLKCKKVLLICLALQIFIQATIVECNPEPKPKPKKGSFVGALAGGLAGMAVGSLLKRNNQPKIKHHYHYQNPPTYSYAPVAVQSIPVMVQQPVAPVYTQQQPIAPIYQQQQPVAPVYQQQQQQQQPTAPVYQQPQQPMAPVYQQRPAVPVVPATVAFNPGNQSHPVSPIVFATNQSHPVSPMVPAINQTHYISPTVTAANKYLAAPTGNHSHPVTPLFAVGTQPHPSPAAPMYPMAPVATQQYAPVAAQQPNVGTAQVFVLSKRTGHYGRNSADSLITSSYIAVMLMPIFVYFI